MTLKTGDEYKESVKSLKLEAHVMGKKSDNLPENPLVNPSMKAVAATFDGAHSDDEEIRNLFRARSSVCQAEVNRFAHLHQSTEDLVKKVLMQRYCGL
jgi:4-hydroxybutyryl-CoA dehydratase/vinylacetyl-CoA-Delta-isomerase